MNERTDPVIGLAKLLGVMIGAQVAEILAPQLSVAIAAALGGVLGLMRWHPCTRTRACGYVLACAVGGWLFAYALAGLLGALHPAAANVDGLPLVAALAIGAIGHDWPEVLMWVFRRGKERAEK